MKRLASLVLGVCLTAAPASALDLTGTWEVRFSCNEYDGAPARFSERGEIFRITQTGNDLRVAWVDGIADGFDAILSGVAVPDAKDPERKGEVAIADCETTADLASSYVELMRLAAKTDRAKDKGSLRGLTIYGGTGDLEFVGTCRASFKLVDLADPGVGVCP